MSRYPRITAEVAPHNRELDLLEKKIILAADGSMMKFFESTLRDKLSKGNALAIADYIIAMERKINPRLNYVTLIIHSLNLCIFE
jgi:hypothetical protein